MLGWCQLEEYYVQMCPLQFQSLAQLFWWTVTALQSPPGNALSLVLFFVPSDVEIDFLNPFWRMIDVESLIDESAHV